MTDTNQMDFIPIDEPYDEYEVELIRRIEELRRDYESAAKPYIDALTRARSLKPSRYYMFVPKMKNPQ